MVRFVFQNVRGCAPAKTKQEMDQMTSYRLETLSFEIVQGERSVDHQRHLCYIANNSTRGVKKSSLWRF